jgi:hypothetical protein
LALAEEGEFEEFDAEATSAFAISMMNLCEFL